MILLPASPLPTTPERIAAAKDRAQSVGYLLGLKARKKFCPPGTFYFLERRRGDIRWTCSFDDTEFKICAGNKMICGRLVVQIFATFKVKTGRDPFATELPDLSQAFGQPYFSRDRFVAKTRAFVLKEGFTKIYRTLDFDPIQTFNFTESQFLSTGTFSTAQACADLLCAIENIMQLLHQERLPEIEKLRATKGLKVRRPYAKLSLRDLETYPVWEFASDEEDIPGQDETTLRPCLDATVRRGEGCYLLRATFTLADGTKARGFLTSVDDPARYRLMAPTVLIGKRQLPLVLSRNEDAQAKCKLWKKTHTAIFPLHFSTEMTYDGRFLSSALETFLPEA